MFENNKQIANSPQASSATIGEESPIVAGAMVVLWGSPPVGTAMLGYDGSYVILQNTGTVNIELLFNFSLGAGITLYPGATFECAVAQGLMLFGSVAAGPTAGEIRGIRFA